MYARCSMYPIVAIAIKLQKNRTLAYNIRFGIWHLAINAALCGRIRCAIAAAATYREFTKRSKALIMTISIIMSHQVTTIDDVVSSKDVAIAD